MDELLLLLAVDTSTSTCTAHGVGVEVLKLLLRQVTVHSALNKLVVLWMIARVVRAHRVDLQLCQLALMSAKCLLSCWLRLMQTSLFMYTVHHSWTCSLLL